MTLVAVASAKGSPGVSVAAELLALLWPGVAERRLLLDCDPAGSAMVLRPGVAPDVGLVSLAAAARRELRAELLAEHTQRLGSLEVLAGPAAARQAHAALESLGAGLAAAAAADADAIAVADCGRLQPATPALPLLRAADRVVLLCRPTAAGAVHAAPWVGQLGAEGCRVAVALAAQPRGSTETTYGEREVADALGVAVVGTVAHDPAAAAALHHHPGRLDGIGRSPLARSVSAVAARLAAPQPPPRQRTTLAAAAAGWRAT